MTTDEHVQQVLARMPMRRRLAFAALTVLVALMTIELAVRGLGLAGQSRAARIVHSVIQNSGLVVEDGRLFWRLRSGLNVPEHEWVAGALRTNALGLRGGEVASPKPAGVRRIVCLGDSCTFGWQVAEDAAYPRRLADLLGSETEVINGGLPGYTSLQGLRWAKREVPRLGPDVITVMFGWNDLKLATGGVPDAARTVLSPGELRVQRALLHWQTLTWLRAHRAPPGAAAIAGPEGDGQVARVSLDEFATNLARLIEHAEAHGARTILITMPIAPLEGVETVGVDADALAYRHAQYMDAVRGLADRWHVPLIDADALLSGRAEYFDNTPADFIHFNSAGHAAISRALADTIATLPPATGIDVAG